jgi:predicted ABC-type transport system involved in lysophospholipase L1 biosynthesis ATPase subunit
LHSLNQEHGTTIVVITHEREVARACRRNIELRDGLVVRDEALN